MAFQEILWDFGVVCLNAHVFNVNDVTTAEYFSRRAAKYQMKKKSSTENKNQNNYPSDNASVNTSIVWEDSVPVVDLYKARQNSLFLFFEGQAAPIWCNKIRYDEELPFKERADSNPMHAVKE